MTGKMRAALTPFFTHRHEVENAKLQRKIWAVLEKNNDLLFLRFYIVGFSKGSPVQIANITNVFLLNTALLGFSG